MNAKYENKSLTFYGCAPQVQHLDYMPSFAYRFTDSANLAGAWMSRGHHRRLLLLQYKKLLTAEIPVPLHV